MLKCRPHGESNRHQRPSLSHCEASYASPKLYAAWRTITLSQRLRLEESFSLRRDSFRCATVLSSLNRTRKSVERANSPLVRQALTVRFEEAPAARCPGATRQNRRLPISPAALLFDP